MRVEWFGQSAFALSGERGRVFIDPFDNMSRLQERGIEFGYPPIEAGEVDLVLVTHEHVDHNGVDAIDGEPPVLRSTAGKLESPIGEVVAIASEHDDAAGTARGPNTIFAFGLDGIRVAHLGDFGQAGLRPEQAAELAGTDLLFVPIGGGPTIGSDTAAQIVEALGPRWAVPMHYRTPRISFLESEEDFLARMEPVERLPGSGFDTADLPDGDGTLTVVPAAP